MRYLEALENLEHAPGHKSIFLAGGITRCPDWQQELVQLLSNTDLILLNPRRANFPIHKPNGAREQIVWEHNHLHKANAIAFWFCKETIQPIALYELGAWSMSDKLIFIGIDSEYQRRQDIEIQTELARPEVKIVYSLQGLAAQIRRKLVEIKPTSCSVW